MVGSRNLKLLFARKKLLQMELLWIKIAFQDLGNDSSGSIHEVSGFWVARRGVVKPCFLTQRCGTGREVLEALGKLLKL